MARQKTVNRRIQFFRVYNGEEEGVPRKFLAQEFVQRIESIAAPDRRRDWYGDYTSCKTYDVSANPAVSFLNVREATAPPLSDSQLNMEKARDGLHVTEVSYCVFFPETNSVGILFNIHGPSHSRIEKYLKDLFVDECSMLTIRPLLHPNIQRQLESLQSLSFVEIRMSPDNLLMVEEAGEMGVGSLLSAGSTIHDTTRCANLVMQMTAGQGKNSHLEDGFLDRIKRIIANGALTLFSGCKVRGKDAEGTSIPVNLFRNQLQYSKKVVRGGSDDHALNHSSAFYEIRRAYIDAVPLIKEAWDVQTKDKGPRSEK